MNPLLAPLIVAVGCILAVVMGVELASDNSMAFIVFVGAFSILFAFIFPFWALGGGFLIQTVFKTLLDAASIGFGVTLVTFFLPLPALLAQGVLHRDKMENIGRTLIMSSLAFLAVGAIVYVFTSHSPVAQYYFRIHMRYPFVFILIALAFRAWRVISLKGAAFFVWIIVTASWINSVFAINEFHFLPNWPTFLYQHHIFLSGFEGAMGSDFQELVLYRKRAFGLMGSPHSVAVCALIGFAFFLARCADMQRLPLRAQILQVHLFLVALYAVYVSGFRTGLLCVPILIGLAFLVGRKRLRLSVVLGSSLALAAVGLAIVMTKVSSNALNDILSWNDYAQKLSSQSLYNSRFSWLLSNIQDVMRNPVGYGFSHEYDNSKMGSDWGGIESSFLILAADGGVALFLAFLGILYGLWRVIDKVEKLNRVDDARWLILFSRLMFVTSVVFHLFSPLIEGNPQFHFLNAMIALPLFLVLAKNKQMAREEADAPEAEAATPVFPGRASG